MLFTARFLHNSEAQLSDKFSKLFISESKHGETKVVISTNHSGFNVFQT